MKDLKISTELISSVLVKETRHLTYDTIYVEDNFIIFSYEGEYQFEVNIYEFAFKCKEWAENKGYIIFSKNKECLIYSIDEVYDVIECLNQYEDYFEGNTEIETIIKSCNWILEQNK